MAVAIKSPLSARLAPLLPLLRRYARALTGSQEGGDAEVEKLLEQLLADPVRTSALLDAGGDDRVALYAAFETVGLERVTARTDGSRHEQAVADKLRALAPLEHRALLLTALEEFTEAQAAAVLGMPVADLRALAASARLSLRSLGAARIVVIEDEPIIAADLEAIVGDLGHAVVARAATRTAGVEAVLAHGPDLVLADIRLGDGSSGIEAVRDILATLDVPVIFVTAFPERLLTGVRPEPTFLVVKPFRAQAVQAAVARALFFRSSAALV